jgi:hypothetical protein
MKPKNIPHRSGTIAHPGLATIVVSLRNRTVMVQPSPGGGVQVAFASGDIIILGARTVVGRIEAISR